MRKMLTRVLMLLCAAFTFTTVMAQQAQPLPIDQNVRIGQLPNGLTYYIRHNEKPKGQADFYIAQRVGSALENDDQRGLAHFLEHMCFNGTTHFPGHDLIDWLSTVGVKFGDNLNAYTGVDETVYNISNVPVARESVQDSCLLILHDWANDLLLEDAEIDSERGVIHEEWRMSMKGNMRILEKILPTMFPGSKYGERLPIGTMEVVDNFPYQALRDYYEKWYRPDQQGIIVVGDIDVDRIEGKIKEIFADIEMPENAAERTYEPVPDTEGTIFAIGADPEMKNAVAQIMFKHDAFPPEMRNDVQYLIYQYLTRMAGTMLDKRLDEIAATPDAPFAQAGAHDGIYVLAKTKDSFNVSGVAKEDDVRPVIAATYRELLRALRGGFTVTEYERARDEYLSRLENIYNNRESVENGLYVHEYVRNFIDNDPIPGIETEYQILSSIIPMVTVDVINQVFPSLIGDNVNNRVVTIMMPEKEGVTVPTADEIAAIMAAVDAEEIEPYTEEVKTEPLIPELRQPGTIVSTTKNDLWDATEWTLSNGAKVVIKHTDYQADEIMMNAYAKGGTSAIAEQHPNEIIFMPSAMSKSGLGDYTSSDMAKYLSGKRASVNLSVNQFSRVLDGYSTPKDLPTLMELIYATMTSYTISPDDYVAAQNTFRGRLGNQESTPEYIFTKQLLQTMFPDLESRRSLNTAIIDSANRDVMLDIIGKMTANAADFTFVFVGNVDEETLRPLVEKYIASLPGDAATATTSSNYDPKFAIAPGVVNSQETMAMQTPQTYLAFIATADIPYNTKNVALANIAAEVWGKRLRNTIREDWGATYSVGGYPNFNRLGIRNAWLLTQLPMKPEFKERVVEFINAQLKDMENNISAEDIQPVIESMVKEAKENKENNGYWLDEMSNWYNDGIDTAHGDIEVYNSITVDDVKDFVKALNAQGNTVTVILDPAE